MIRSYKTDIESQLGPNINIVGSFFDYFIYDGVDVKIDIDKLIKDQKLFEGRLADGGDLVEEQPTDWVKVHLSTELVENLYSNVNIDYWFDTVFNEETSYYSISVKDFGGSYSDNIKNSKYLWINTLLGYSMSNGLKCITEFLEGEFQNVYEYIQRRENPKVEYIPVERYTIGKVPTPDLKSGLLSYSTLFRPGEDQIVESHTLIGRLDNGEIDFLNLVRFDKQSYYGIDKKQESKDLYLDTLLDGLDKLYDTQSLDTSFELLRAKAEVKSLYKLGIILRPNQIKTYLESYKREKNGE